MSRLHCFVLAAKSALAAQSPFGDTLRYASTAVWSSALVLIFVRGFCGQDAGGSSCPRWCVVSVHISFDAGWLLVHNSLDIDPVEPTNMCVLIACEWTHRAPQRLCLKDFAFRNMFFMVVTLETCHFEMSRLNDVAPWNIPDIYRTLDTSHRAIETSHFGSCLTQLSTARLSSAVDRSENPCRRGKGASKQ